MSLVSELTKEQLEEYITTSHSYREVLRKIGYHCNNGYLYKLVKNRAKELGITVQPIPLPNLLETRKDTKKTAQDLRLPDEVVFTKNAKIDKTTVRAHFKSLTKDMYYCWICGQEPEWNGQPLTMIMDHIDGDNCNHTVENLRWVCPNCNYQLPTTNGKNIASYKNRERRYCPDCGKELKGKTTIRCNSCANKINIEIARQNSAFVKNQLTREELKDLIRTTPFVKIGEKFGVTDNAVRKWCKHCNLPYRSQDIKNISDEEWEKL